MIAPREHILFVCEHGAAKSVVASAWFNKLAADKGLDVRSIARATHPDPELSPRAVEGLANDGLTPADSVPQILSFADVEAVASTISFCELPGELINNAITELWDDVPAVSDGYEAARDAIVNRINKLLSSLLSTDPK